MRATFAAATLFVSSVFGAATPQLSGVQVHEETSPRIAFGNAVWQQGDPLLPPSHAKFELPVDDKHLTLDLSVSANQDVDEQCGNYWSLLFYTEGNWVTPVAPGASQLVRLELDDSRAQKTHSVVLYVESSCQGSVEVTRGRVIQVDGVKRSLDSGSTADFSLHWDQLTLDVLGIHIGTEDPLRQDLQEILSTPTSFLTLLGPTDGPVALPYDEAEHGLLYTQDGHLVTPSAEVGIRILETIEEELSSVEERYRQQREIVNQLTHGTYHSKYHHIKDDEKWLALIRKLFAKGKDCLHHIYLKVATYVHPRETRSNPCTSLMAAVSPAARAKVLINSAMNCAEEKDRPDRSQYTLLDKIDEKVEVYDDEDKKYDELDTGHSNTTRTSVSSIPSDLAAPQTLTPAFARETFATRHKIHAILAAALGLLCLTCFSAFLHRRCCSPRARADRAARCEERRNECQYRRAARKQAWRDWWSSKRGCLCCGARRELVSNDYEEKRALIMQQENILENAMQDRIRVLEREHLEARGENLSSAAEEGRIPLPHSAQTSTYRRPSDRRSRGYRTNRAGSGSSADGSLPSYRSRDSSRAWGRPPSYRSRAASSPGRPEHDIVPLAVDGFVPDGFVTDGFAGYMPDAESSSEEGEEGEPDGSEAHLTDRTPDSSVVGISPRISSETLRSERSVL